MARKMCTDCGTRVVGTGPISHEDREYAKQQGMCGPCADEGQMDIAHNNGHEDITTDECWYCHPELDARNTEIKHGHTNTVAKTRGSHAGCDHMVTPKARAACRKARAAK